MKAFKTHIALILLATVLLPNIFQSFHIHAHNAHYQACTAHHNTESDNCYTSFDNEDECLICNFEFVTQVLPPTTYQSQRFTYRNNFYQTAIKSYTSQSIFYNFLLRAPPYKTADIA